jgi:hypothetical protein
MMEIDQGMAFNVLVYFVGALLSILLAVLTWIGGHVITSLKDLTIEVKTVNATITSMEKDLRETIYSVESHAKDVNVELVLRVAKLEERCESLQRDIRILEDAFNHAPK